MATIDLDRQDATSMKELAFLFELLGWQQKRCTQATLDAQRKSREEDDRLRECGHIKAFIEATAEKKPLESLHAAVKSDVIALRREYEQELARDNKRNAQPTGILQ